MASPARLKKVLITGAGTGVGQGVATRLAEKNFDVIAAVEIYEQVQTLKRQAADRSLNVQVVKLDVTNDGDRRKALDWEIEILINDPEHPDSSRRCRGLPADDGRSRFFNALAIPAPSG